MRLMTGGDAVLTKSLKDLLTAWDEAGSGWHDAARDGFAAEHLEPIALRTREAAQALKRLDALLQEVVRQCQ